MYGTGLWSVLQEHNLTSDAKFFHCLKEAYYNSGRISEGVEVCMIYIRISMCVHACVHVCVCVNECVQNSNSNSKIFYCL